MAMEARGFARSLGRPFWRTLLGPSAIATTMLSAATVERTNGALEAAKPTTADSSKVVVLTGVIGVIGDDDDDDKEEEEEEAGFRDRRRRLMVASHSAGSSVSRTPAPRRRSSMKRPFRFRTVTCWNCRAMSPPSSLSMRG